MRSFCKPLYIAQKMLAEYHLIMQRGWAMTGKMPGHWSGHRLGTSKDLSHSRCLVLHGLTVAYVVTSMVFL